MVDQQGIVSPGKILEEMLKERGWTQMDLANILDKPQRSISEIITGKKAVTPETACALAQVFNNDPAFWIDLEGRYRLSLAGSADAAVRERAKLYELAPIKDMEKRGWIKKATSAEEIAAQLKKFFGVDDLALPLEIGAHAKKTLRETPLTAEQRAWCFRARNLAASQQVGRFTPSNFDSGVKELRDLAAWPEETRRVPKVLAEMGIRLVVNEPLPRTRIDGAAFWLDEESPAVAVSVRYDRIDSFWHTLGHELSHIRHRDGLMVDVDLVGESRPSPVELSVIERRADAEAVTLVVDHDQLEDFIIRVGPLYSRARINQFANKIRIHPGIIVGQLQYRGELNYSQLRDNLVKVREFVTAEVITDGWGHVTTI
jgi:HTH-type transcriptional regulator/antitoxin HigA